jgi:ATP-dependent Clp protease adaptor protein ClpS
VNGSSVNSSLLQPAFQTTTVRLQAACGAAPTVNPSLRIAAALATGGPPRGGSTLLPSATSTPGETPGGATVLDKAPERVRKPSPRYKVLLHNDPVNTMEYVVVTLRQVVPSLSEQDAIAVMLETHNTGVGLVIVCDIEPAEFYCETLKAKGLTSTIEPES